MLPLLPTLKYGRLVLYGWDKNGTFLESGETYYLLYDLDKVGQDKRWSLFMVENCTDKNQNKISNSYLQVR